MYKIYFFKSYNKQNYIINNLSCADSFLKRLIGLMGKKNFNGIIFRQKNNNRFYGSIHTCFMKKNIDVIYINTNMQIQEIRTLQPWKLYVPIKGNIKYIIELPERSINNHNIEINDTINKIIKK